MKNRIHIFICFVLLTMLLVPMYANAASIETESPIPFYAEITDEFQGGTLIVIIKKEYSYPNHQWDISGFGSSDNIAAVVDLTKTTNPRVIASDTSNENFRQILEVYLTTNDKQKTINIAEQISQLSYVYSVSLNYLYSIPESETKKEGTTHTNRSIPANAFVNNCRKVTEDTDITSQYSIFQTQTHRAWGITKGSEEIIVGVIDSGIDPIPDLLDNLVPGYDMSEPSWHSTEFSVVIDDLPEIGDTEPYVDVLEEKHGTKVASIIASAQNDIGITGIAPNIKVMPLRVCLPGSPSPVATSYVRAFAMARELELPVVNFSINTYKTYTDGLGLPYLDQRNYQWLPVLQNYQGLIVNSAGNDSMELIKDSAQIFPVCFKDNGLDNILVVGAINESYELCEFSNWGSDYVDLMAPGELISCYYGMDIQRNSTNDVISISSVYAQEDGTSFSAPMVSAAAALILSINPNLSTEQVKSALLDNVTIYDEMETWCSSSGILNVYEALLSVGPTMYNYCVSISNEEAISSASDFVIHFPSEELQLTDIYICPTIAESFLHNIYIDIETGTLTMNFASINMSIGSDTTLLEVWFSAPENTIQNKFSIVNNDLDVDMGNNYLNHSIYLLGDTGKTGVLDSNIIFWIEFIISSGNYTGAADVNRDGVVDTQDKIRAQQYLNGEIKSLF